jgi:hypothetical protein
MLERDVQSKSVKAARKAGWWASKFVAQGRRSAPDYIFAKKVATHDWREDSHVFFVEFKRLGEKPTELQAQEHTVMRSHGLTVYVCDSVESFMEILRNYE